MNSLVTPDSKRFLHPEAIQRIARLDAKGERYFLEEAQIQQEATQARQAIQQWCN